jgi:hypothetical protein
MNKQGRAHTMLFSLLVVAFLLSVSNASGQGSSLVHDLGRGQDAAQEAKRTGARTTVRSLKQDSAGKRKLVTTTEADIATDEAAGSSSGSLAGSADLTIPDLGNGFTVVPTPTFNYTNSYVTKALPFQPLPGPIHWGRTAIVKGWEATSFSRSSASLE